MTTEIELLQRASNEIKQLRNQNQLQGVRLAMFDDCMKLLNAHQPSNAMGYGEDIAWAIDKHIAESEKTV